MSNIDSQILSDRARAELAAKIAQSFDGMNPEYVTVVEDQLPPDYIEDTGSPLGSYPTGGGLVQKVTWNFSTEQWDTFGEPLVVQSYVDAKADLTDERFLTSIEKAVVMADRWKIKFADEGEWEQSHEGFGGMGEFPDQTLGLMYRIGSRHNLSYAPLFFSRSTDKYGYGWDQRVLVDDMPGHDIRNGCVGIGENGDVIGLFQNRQVSPAVTLDPALYFSTDEGQTWTKQVHDLAMTPHGDIIEMPNRYLASGYAGGLEYVRIVEITKNFNNVQVIKQFDSDDFDSSMDPEDFQISEAAIVKIDDDVIIGTIRNQTPPGAVMQFFSEDGGQTWSDIFPTNIFAGATPHILFNDGVYIYMCFPSRLGDIGPSLPAPSLEAYGRNYMLTYKPINKILDMTSEWMFPVPLFPVSDHGSDSNGDIERGHLFKRNEQLHMIWKQGTYMDSTDGETVHWGKNLGRF